MELSQKKDFKRKKIIKKISVAVIVAIALFVGGYQVLSIESIMSYSDAQITTEVQTNMVDHFLENPDGTSVTFTNKEALEFYSPTFVADWYSTSADILDDGITTKYVFFNCTESILSKWKNKRSKDKEFLYSFDIFQYKKGFYYNDKNEKVALPEVDKIEVYYVNKPIKDINVEKDYKSLTQSETLVWNGTLK